MSLVKVSLLENVKRQYRYKLNAYIQVFMSLLIMQLLAILFSLNGVGSMGSGMSLVNVQVNYYSADFVVVFTMLWGFITAIVITTKVQRNADYIFVTNSISTSLANLLFLATASVIGGITAILSSYLLKIIIVLFKGGFYVSSVSDLALSLNLLIGTGVTILYIFLVSILGYFVGTLIQSHRLFAVVVPAMVFGGLLLGTMSGSDSLLELFKFYFSESSLVVFTVKAVVTAGLLFLGAVALSNRMEVKA